MLDPAISAFLNDRIERRVEFKLKDLAKKHGDVSVEDKNEIERLAGEEYRLDNWLTYCAKNAHGISLTTHPCKYSHPDAYSSAVYCKSNNRNIGYMQSGVSSEKEDVIFATAAYMPIYSFLKLKLFDDRELLDHLLSDSDSIRNQFSGVRDYDSIRNSLITVIADSTEQVTNEKIKQVYFPVDDGYHLLSIVSSSVIMFELKERLKTINSYDGNSEARKAMIDETYFKGGYREVFELTMQGHVKSNPQCISQLNKDNYGESYLLSSLPPNISKREANFPKTNFFKESFNRYECRDAFQALHKLLKADYNNINIREGRDYRLQEIIDRVIDKMWAVRSVSSEQYSQKTSGLKLHQRIWLSSEFAEERETTDQWLDVLCKEIARWLIVSYQKAVGKQAVKLSDVEHKHILTVVQESKEALR